MDGWPGSRDCGRRPAGPAARALWAALLLVALATAACSQGTDKTQVPQSPEPPIEPAPSPPWRSHAKQALQIARALASQQTPDGAIADTPGGPLVNEDSNLAYALMGIAAAYDYSADPVLLAALERGIRWLAQREEMLDPRWRGSWYYAYSASPPYAAVPVSPGPGIDDVRGVDATSSLFVYLIYLHQRLSGDDALAKELEPYARAALDFVLTYNSDAGSPFYFSSWQYIDNRWQLWRFQYSADQGDMFLGLTAGSRLYEQNPAQPYGFAAAALASRMDDAYFDAKSARYAVGRESDGTLETSLEDFNGIFPQGYLPWVFGASSFAQQSLELLYRGKQADGSLVLYTEDPRYTLSVSVYAMAARALDEGPPLDSMDWLTSVPYDATNGWLRDSAEPESAVYSNVMGLSVVALLGFPAWP